MIMKKIVITGASDGIGLAAACQLAAQNNKLTLIARNEAKVKEATNSLAGTGHDYVVADLSTNEGIKIVSDYLKNHHPDVLINNAGVGKYGKFEETDLEEYLQMTKLNIIALTSLSHTYLNQAVKGDALVNIGSVLGLSSSPGSSVYSATKAYVTILSESLWHENKRKGIYVLGFNPGATKSNFHKASGGDEHSFPGILLQEPEQVAKELIGALNSRRKPRVVSGGINRLVQFGNRMLPRKATVNIMGRLSPAK
jgi:uncharacterized protein